MSEFQVYKDLAERTGGEFYLGICGPVRTGKSTFIKRFMELSVLPEMEQEHERQRAVDELPQSAAGKTIMTTEPKFIPKEAANVKLFGENEVKIRLIDCVGYIVKGAEGLYEEQNERMVMTPWSESPMPFTQAAEFGTRKVIHDHSTIGIVVTTDGSFGDLPREAFEDPEKRTIQELTAIGKPFVVLVNSAKPYAQETIKLASEMEKKYQTTAVPVNCEQLRREDVLKILESVLYEFPIERVEFFIPKWTEMLSADHPVKSEIIAQASDILSHMERTKDVYQQQSEPGDCISKIKMDEMDLACGCVKIQMEVAEPYYYENMSELAGVPIHGEYELISMIREMAARKESYEKVAGAFEEVQMKGYGVVNPGLKDIELAEPELIHH